MKLYGFENELSKLLTLLNGDKNPPILLNSDGYHFGKKTLAKYVIREFFAQKSNNPTLSYKKFDNGNEVDFLFIKPNEKGQLLLEDVSHIREFMLSKPLQNTYKVVLINEIHTFNAVSQNALLKTLEEPPSFVKFIFTSSILERVLDTIKSRSVLLPINQNSKESIHSYMVDNFADISDKEKEIILQYANSIYSLHLFSDKELDFVNLIDNSFDYFTSISNEKHFILFNNHLLKDENISIKLDVIQRVLFDVLYTKLGLDKYVINKSKVDVLKKLSNETTTTKLIKSIEYTKKYAPYFRVKSIKQDLIINNIVLRLIECFR